jgi:hypothetical protein
MTRSRTSICLKNRNNYRKTEQSAKCVVHFYVHSSAKHISMRYIFIVSAKHTRRNVCRPSSKTCDIPTITKTETLHYITLKLPSTKFHVKSFRGSRVVTSKTDVTTLVPFFNLTFATHNKCGRLCFPRLTSQYFLESEGRKEIQ